MLSHSFTPVVINNAENGRFTLKSQCIFKQKNKAAFFILRLQRLIKPERRLADFFLESVSPDPQSVFSSKK